MTAPHPNPTSPGRLRPAVFFDRDGIVNARPTEVRYVNRPEDFHLIPAFLDALRLVRALGYAVFIATNQRGVGIGAMTREALDDIHARFLRRLADEGLSMDGIRVCTATEDGHPERKPNPGMLLGAAREHRLDLARSWMIGDTESDVLAGGRAGCRTVLVSASAERTQADHRVDNMASLTPLLRRILPPVDR